MGLPVGERNGALGGGGMGLPVGERGAASGGAVGGPSAAAAGGVAAGRVGPGAGWLGRAGGGTGRNGRRSSRSGCSLAGRLVIRRWSGSAGRPLGGAVAAAAGSAASASSLSSASAAGFSAAGFSAAGAFAAAFLAFLGSSGWTSRLSPSRSAFRRTRSAWASSMLEEWLLTPIPSAAHRSSVSLLVSPSSRASS